MAEEKSLGTLARRLKFLRSQRGLTQRQVAKAVGMTQAWYSLVEISRSNLSVQSLKKLSEFFNVPMEWLTEED